MRLRLLASSRRRLLATAAAAVGVCALTATVAVATTLAGWAYADEDGVYYGCVADTTGTLRVVRPGETCRQNEVGIDWHRRGPAGEAGPPGPEGQPGAGSPAAYGHVLTDGTLDGAKSANILGVTKTSVPGTSTEVFPGIAAYCLDLAVQPKAVVASIENSIVRFELPPPPPGSPAPPTVGMSTLALNATVESGSILQFGCSADDEAAVAFPAGGSAKGFYVMSN